MKKIFLTCFAVVSCFFNAQVTQFLCENFTSYFIEGTLMAANKDGSCYPWVESRVSSFPAPNGYAITIPPYSNFNVAHYLSSTNPFITDWGIQFTPAGAEIPAGLNHPVIQIGTSLQTNTDWRKFEFVTRDNAFNYFSEYPMGDNYLCGGHYVSLTRPEAHAEWYTIGEYTIVSVF